MRLETVLLIAEADDRDFSRTGRSLELAGIHNQIIRFKNDQQVLDFLFVNGEGGKRQANQAYVLFLDVGISSAGGLKVLERIKQDTELRKLPVIVLTCTDDVDTIERCHQLGCSIYLVKPQDEQAFTDAVRKVGSFLSVVEVPQIGAKV
ncbi:MAG: response regulator [Planctomycetota bacterium]|jgi:CheY-like chemotaxis protein